MADPTPQPAVTPPSPLKIRAAIGARWFYWIAALSAINSAIALSGEHLVMVVGLGATRLLTELGGQWLGSFAWLTLPLTFAIAAIFALIGLIASRGVNAAYLVGLVLYGLDTLIFVLVPKEVLWLPVLFHLYVSYRIIEGFRANRAAQSAALAAPVVNG